MILRSRKNDFATWDTENMGPAPPAAPLRSQTLPAHRNTKCYPVVRKIKSKLVIVHARTPYITHGAYSNHMKCMRLVLNLTIGFVVTARSFMFSTMWELTIVFADSIEVPATKLYDHVLGFTVLRYDVSLVKGLTEKITFSTKELMAQDKVNILGPEIDNAGLCPTEATVTSVGPLTSRIKTSSVLPRYPQKVLEPGDIIIKQGKNVVTKMLDVRDVFSNECLEMLFIRRQVQINLTVSTIPTSCWQSDRVVWFAGAQLESPNSPVSYCTRKLYSRIFVTCNKLRAHHFVTQWPWRIHKKG